MHQWTYRTTNNKSTIRLNRVRARIRGFVRRIFLPSLFTLVVGIVSLVVNYCYWGRRAQYIESVTDKLNTAADSYYAATVHKHTVESTKPNPEEKPKELGLQHETTGSFNGIEISRVYDHKTQATCYVVNNQSRENNTVVSISCVK